MIAETYRHSGRVGALGAPIIFLVGGISAILLAAVYSYGLAWIPLIYVSFLLTGGFGAILGLIVGICAKIGKIRNPFIVGIFGLMIGALGLYMSWAFDGMARFGTEEIAGPILNPLALKEYMSIFYAEGFWGMGRGGGTVSGIFLGIIWLVEAVIILGLAWLISHGSVASLPFCENCNRWTSTVEGLCQLTPPEDEGTSIEQLLSGDVSALQSFTRSPENAGAYLRLDTAECPDCDDCNCATVNLVEVTVDKDGDNNLSTSALIENMLLSKEDFESMKNIVTDLPMGELPEPVLEE